MIWKRKERVRSYWHCWFAWYPITVSVSYKETIHTGKRVLTRVWLRRVWRVAVSEAWINTEWLYSLYPRIGRLD